MGLLNHEMFHSRLCVPLTSLFLAKLDPGKSQITCSCGGCPAAFLLASPGRVTLIDRGGPVLGALEHAAYNALSFELGPGQVLLAVSDGVTEVHHGAEFELRPDRVVRHLQFANGASAGTSVDSLAHKVRSQAPVLTDDISILAIQRTV